MKRVSHLLHQICYALKDDLDEKEKDLLEEWIAKTDATRNVPWTGELSERLGKTKAALRMMLIRLLDKLGKLLEEYVKEACQRTDDDATEPDSAGSTCRWARSGPVEIPTPRWDVAIRCVFTSVVWNRRDRDFSEPSRAAG